MTTKFLAAVQQLISANTQFAAGEIKSVPHADLRGAALATALQELATEHGVQLQLPLQINSRGEFSINVLPDNGQSIQYGCGSYGAAFADILNRHNPRCGLQPGAILFPESGWCWLNHFDAERMVLSVAQRQTDVATESGPDTASIQDFEHPRG